MTGLKGSRGYPTSALSTGYHADYREEEEEEDSVSADHRKIIS